MDTISVTILLEYIYSKFATTFILCLMGAFIRETAILSKKYKKIYMTNAIVAGFFSSLLVCVLADYLDIPFSLYAALCVVCGMWGHKLLQLFLTADFVKKLLFVLLKNISGPLSRYVNDINKSFIDNVDQTSEDMTTDNSEKNNSGDS